MNTVLELNNINKKFGKTTVLNNVSMKINEGDIYGLIGRNGAGKTTVMKIITTLVRETSGTIAIFGSKNTKEYMKGLSRTSSVIEAPDCYESMSAYENLRYYCINRGIKDFSLIDETLEFVDLADTGNKKAKSFSLGMKQRLGLALSLVSSPDFLILDEPINGLDPIAIIEFRELLEKINRERNTTIMISSHILGELYHVSTRFGFIHKGTMIKELTKAEFDDECKDRIVIETKESEKASVLLTEANIVFNIMENRRIEIFDFDDIGFLNQLLMNANIAVEGIYREGVELENYFKELIKEME